MRIHSYPFTILAITCLTFLSACSDSAAKSPIVSDRSVVTEHKMTPEQMRALTGVDRLPEVLDKAAFKATIERNYPADLRLEAVSGSALIDVLIDTRGQVESVTAVDRPAGVRAVLILEEKDGTQRQVTPHDRPAFQVAAIRALREVRFSPAVRDGHPVPYTLRMTVTFDPPARRN